MLKLDRTFTLGDIARVGAFLVLAGLIFARTEAKISSIDKSFIKLDTSIGELSKEIVELRVELGEARATIDTHMRYDDMRDKGAK